MSLANGLKQAASKTLSKLGGDVTIKQVTAGAYVTSFDDISAIDDVENIDNFTGGTIQETVDNFTIKGVIRNARRFEANNLIEAQNKIVTIAAKNLNFIPTTKDRVVISNVEFKISQVISIKQNSSPISFDLILV